MKKMHPLLSVLTVIAVIAALVLQAVPGALAAPPTAGPGATGKELWQRVAGTPAPARAGAQPGIKAQRSNSYTLNRRGMAAVLATAPNERSQVARKNPLVLSLPNPLGKFESFAVQESPIM